MRTIPISGVILSAICTLTLGAEQKGAADRTKVEEMTRLQILLDHAGFGPGKIDGRGGEFTRKALERYRASQGAGSQYAVATGDEKAKTKSKDKGSGDSQIDTSGLDLQSVGEPFISYTVTKEDIENLSEVPKEPEAQAKLKFLPYETAWEQIAEKFHADPDFLKELNPNVKPESIKEGDQLSVPNVAPFELAKVKELKPGEALKKGQEEDAAPAEAANGPDEKDEKEATEKESSVKVAIHIDTGDKMLEVRQDEKLIAAFPVTPGSDDIPTPTGEWKVKGVAKMPDFRYDKKLLKQGERGEDSHLIPPGPNSPVGVIWIALNKPGIGIHGTNDPETIGRAASHGCIRLANWDAVKLARLVKGGVPVTIK